MVRVMLMEEVSVDEWNEKSNSIVGLTAVCGFSIGNVHFDPK